MLKFRKYHKTLHVLREKQSELSDEYTQLTDHAGCVLCSHYNSKAVDTFANKFINCSDCNKAEKIRTVSKELDSIETEIDSFVEKKYAKAVFDYFNVKKPLLSESSSGAKVSWDDAFGNDFSKVSKTLKHSIVGLVEGTGRYSLK